MSQNPSALSARAQSALQGLYEDANLRDELTDDEAQPLLQWAEAQIAHIDTRSPDDAAFETSLEALRRLLKAINRFVGRRPFSTPDEQAEGLAKIAEHAQTLGYALPPQRQSAFLQSQAAVDNQTALSTVLNEISGAVTEAPAESADSPTQDSAPAQQLGDWSQSRFSPPQTTIESSDNPNKPAADASLPAIQPSKDEPSPDPSSGEPF